jgi:ectoine hydroxylase-related dioxygenase (phytanoyl-CoA dioxygenase family)
VSLSERVQERLVGDDQQPVVGLYEMQEKLIIDRGAFEEELMANQCTPIEANKPKIRGVGKSGGFGGGTGGGGGASGGGKSSSAGLKAEGKAHAKVLQKEGVVRIDNVLSASVVDELGEFVYELKEQAEQDVASGAVKSIYRFANVLLKTNRCDLTMPLGPDIVTRALVDVFLKSPVRYTIENLLGKNAILYELSCLISYPGSQRQVVHPDTPYGASGGLADDEPVLYTCFIALQDISLDMGPTVWLPNTHTKDAHDRFRDESSPSSSSGGGGGGGGEQQQQQLPSPKDVLLSTAPAKLGTLPKGSCGIYDSRLLHCGGANRSQNPRALFYFSFKNPKVGSAGNPGSIRPELVGKISLNNMCKDLEGYQKGGTCPQLEALAATLR